MRARLPLILCATFLASAVYATGSAPERIEGLWVGKLEFPGLELTMVFELEGAGPEGITGTLSRPDAGDDAIPISKAYLEGMNLRLEIEALGASFQGRIAENWGAIEGRWDHASRSMPLVLTRTAEIVLPRRPQTPHPPYPYEEVEVTCPGRAAGVRLAGTLTLPNLDRPCAVVILIPGGGAHDRDYTILRHRPFLVLADRLTRRGVAVLRFDERGVGESQGERASATSATYAEDVMAGLDFLAGRPEIDPDRIGLIGHSEGGTIASLAAATSPQLAS